MARNGAAARRCDEQSCVWQEPNENVDDTRVCENELERECEYQGDYFWMTAERQSAEQAWVEDAVNDETSKSEVVVGAYGETEVVVLHGELVGQVRAREKESAHE